MNDNGHVVDYLNYYLNELKNPDYAVMITGCWGSGKTYFIKHFLFENGDTIKINDWLSGSHKYTVVYVSLFGANCREEIDNRIAERFHHVLDSDYVKGLKKIGFMGLSVIADICHLQNSVADAKNAVDEFIDSERKNLTDKKLVVVFDDVERADLPLPELLGYLNEYVEGLHIPCILLADENKWNEAKKCQEDKGTLHKLSSTQEKIIGRVLKIQTTPQTILSYWLKNNSLGLSDKTLSLWENNQNLVLDFFAAMDALCEKKKESSRIRGKTTQGIYDEKQIEQYAKRISRRNYRALKQTILDFEYLCVHFCPEFGIELLSEISHERKLDSLFLKQFISMKYGLLLDLYNVNAIGKHRPYSINNDEKPIENSLTEWECFDKIRYDYESIDFFPWEEWLKNGSFDKETVLRKMRESKWLGGFENYALQRLLSWYDLTDEEAKEYYAVFRSQINENSLLESAMILRLYAVFFTHALDGIMPFSADSFDLEMKNYIEQNSECINPTDYPNEYEFSDVRNSWEHHKDKLMPFYTLLLNIVKKNQTGKVSQAEIDFITLLQSDKWDDRELALGHMQRLWDNDETFPLCHFDVETLVDVYCKKNEIRNRFRNALKYRYLEKNSLNNLPNEIDFLNRFRYAANYRIEKQKSTPLPSTAYLKYLIETIDEILVKLIEKSS